MDLCGPLGSSSVERQALLSIIEGLAVGVCVLDSSGRVELSNSEFLRQQEVHNAFWTDKHNRLKLHENADRQQYARLLEDARPIKIDVALAQLAFGFTPIESEVTQLVCEGLTNSEIADRRSRSVETINAQVKTIFGKSSVANRTQLVRLLCNFSITDPAGFAITLLKTGELFKLKRWSGISFARDFSAVAAKDNHDNYLHHHEVCDADEPKLFETLKLGFAKDIYR